MDIRYQKIGDRDDEKQDEVKLKNIESQQAKLLEVSPPPPERAAPPPPERVASPPSAASSPAHEFSFTISLHPSAATKTAPADKTEPPPPPPPSLAIDLSPADDIFFHGHLLPLHLLSHLPVSPRSSTNSIDSFTLPINQFSEPRNQNLCNTLNRDNNSDDHQESKPRIKPKSFSLFGLPKRRKGCEIKEKEHEKQKRKLRFDLSSVLKRYLKMVRPLLSFRNRNGDVHFQRQSYSFSGNLSSRSNKKELISRRRGDYSSAPASMWTSPTNSGHLVPTGNVPVSNSDSTMEELQAAIQAAIAHCKNSIAVEDKRIHV